MPLLKNTPYRLGEKLKIVEVLKVLGKETELMVYFETNRMVFILLGF